MVTFNFPPMVGGGVPRMAQFAKYLPQFGWQPTVLTVPMIPETAVDMQTLESLPEEVEVVRAHCPLARVGAPGQPLHRTGLAGMKRWMKRKFSQLAFVPDRQVLWYPYAVKAGKEVLRNRRFDAVFATYGPATDLLIANRLARWANLPLVIDYQDLWGDDPLWEWGSPLHRRMNQAMERRIIRRAEKVIAVSDPMAEHFRQRYPIRDGDVYSIPNGFDPETLSLVHDSRELSNPNRTKRICFTGSASGKTDFSALFGAIGDLAREGKVTPEQLRIEFVSNMTLDEPRRLGVADYVEVRPPVPHAEVFNVLARSDVLMMIEPPGYCVKYSYACKMFDYMLAGKPILALIEEGENSAPVIREGDLGWIAHPNDRPAVRAVLEAILAGERQQFRSVDILRNPWRRFDRKRQTEQLADVLEEVGTRPAVTEKESVGQT